MSDNFLIEDDIIEEIASFTDLSEENILKIQDKFEKDVRNFLPKHYLSHLLLQVQSIVRETFDEPLFRIDLRECFSVRHARIDIYYEIESNKEVEQKRVIAPYVEIGYSKKNVASEREQRIQIAHELGHLIFACLKKEDTLQKSISSSKEKLEDFATTWAFFALSERSHFYENRGREYNYKNCGELLLQMRKLLEWGGENE